jgi:hypothetical protein
MNPLFLNEYFMPLIQDAVIDDPALATAFNKVKGKFESFSSYRQTKVDELKLRDLCTSDLKLHPHVRRYIEQIPQRSSQTRDRYEKYKVEIGSNMLRAVEAAARARQLDGEMAENEVQEKSIPIIHEYPLLAEIYKLLPGKKTPSGKGFIHVNEPSELGLLFYTGCAGALKNCSPASVKEFLSTYVSEIRRSCKSVCPPDKLSSVVQIFITIRRNLGIQTSRKCKLLLEQWPSPLREEMRNLYAAVRGNIPEHVYEKARQHDITLKSELSHFTVLDAEELIERLIRHYPLGQRLSVRDILKTTETVVSKPEGGKTILYENEFLTPFRQAEQEKVSDGKRKGFDSRSFKNAVSSLLVLSSYNGIFDYYELVKKAFAPKLDVVRIKERKAQKKAVIDRQVIDKWLADEFPKFETILNTGSFKRDKRKRLHPQSDDNMRFILFYLRFITIKVMGHRQRQLRDCKYGENLIVAPDSITFKFSGRQTKNRKPLQFTANEKTSGKSHGLLIKAHYLYYRRAFAYVQARYAPWSTDVQNPHNQVFVYLTNDGLFKRYERDDTKRFSSQFKLGCYKYLKHPELLKEAALLAHAHYFRGAAMDTFVFDQGGSPDAASKYFGVSGKVMEQFYKDKDAPQDASRDVILMNAQMKELDALMSRADARQASEDGKADEQSSEVIRHLMREMEELRKEVKEKDLLLRAAQARVEALELNILSRLAQPQQSETSERIQEILDLLRASITQKAT